MFSAYGVVFSCLNNTTNRQGIKNEGCRIHIRQPSILIHNLNLKTLLPYNNVAILLITIVLFQVRILIHTILRNR